MLEGYNKPAWALHIAAGILGAIVAYRTAPTVVGEVNAFLSAIAAWCAASATILGVKK